MKGHCFEAIGLVSGYDATTVVNDVSLELPDGKISIIIGANACGKSTLLKTLTRLIKPMSGQVLLDGVPIRNIAPKKLARTVALLPQTPVVPEGISVSDLVGRGRYPHQRLLQGRTKRDKEAVAEAMELMNISEYANRSITELSGGQRQRVWIAMALAQQTDILFLDEPTTFLDITYQVEILELLKTLNHQRKITIAMVLHEINLSSRYGDYLFAMKGGRLIAQGSPQEVITKPLMREVFDLNAEIISDPVSGAPFVIPVARAGR